MSLRGGSAPGQETVTDPVTPLVAAYVGKHWDSHYRSAWEKLGSPIGLQSGVSWNWAAAFFHVAWLAYRRRFVLAVVILFVWLMIGGSSLRDLASVAPFALFLFFGIFGDRIVLGRAWRTADAALRQHGPGEQASEEVVAAGGVSRLGLAGLLIPVSVAVGVAIMYVASVTTPKWRSYRTQMISELLTIHTAESTYFAANARYTSNLDDTLFVPTSGLTSRIVAMEKGWTATTTHAQVPDMTCGIGVGLPNPVIGTASDGEPACTKK